MLFQRCVSARYNSLLCFFFFFFFFANVSHIPHICKTNLNKVKLYCILFSKITNSTTLFLLRYYACAYPANTQCRPTSLQRRCCDVVCLLGYVYSKLIWVSDNHFTIRSTCYVSDKNLIEWHVDIIINIIGFTKTLIYVCHSIQHLAKYGQLQQTTN